VDDVHRPWSALIVAFTLALLPIFMVLLGLEAKDRMDHSWAQQQVLANYFGDVVRGMATLKAHNRSTAVTENLGDVGNELRLSTMKTLRVAFLSDSHWNFCPHWRPHCALVLGIRLIDGDMRLTTALAVLLITPRSTFRCVGLRLGSTRRRRRGSGRRTIGSARGGASDERHGERTHLAPRIELCDVRVGVDGRDHQSLLALSTVIEPGTVVALEGRRAWESRRSFASWPVGGLGTG